MEEVLPFLNLLEKEIEHKNFRSISIEEINRAERLIAGVEIDLEELLNVQPNNKIL